MNSATQHRKATHRGVSLAEALSVMVISTVILSVAGKALHTVLDHRHSASRSANFYRTISRMSHQFRADVTSSASVEGQPDGLAFRDDRGTTHYALGRAPNVLNRVRLEGADAHHEEFVLPESCRFRLNPQTAPTGATLAIMIGDPSFRTTGSSEGHATPKEIRVTAYFHSRAARVSE